METRWEVYIEKVTETNNKTKNNCSVKHGNPESSETSMEKDPSTNKNTNENKGEAEENEHLWSDDEDIEGNNHNEDDCCVNEIDHKV